MAAVENGLSTIAGNYALWYLSENPTGNGLQVIGGLSRTASLDYHLIRPQMAAIIDSLGDSSGSKPYNERDRGLESAANIAFINGDFEQAMVWYSKVFTWTWATSGMLETTNQAIHTRSSRTDQYINQAVERLITEPETNIFDKPEDYIARVVKLAQTYDQVNPLKHDHIQRQAKTLQILQAGFEFSQIVDTHTLSSRLALFAPLASVSARLGHDELVDQITDFSSSILSDKDHHKLVLDVTAAYADIKNYETAFTYVDDLPPQKAVEGWAYILSHTQHSRKNAEIAKKARELITTAIESENCADDVFLGNSISALRRTGCYQMALDLIPQIDNPEVRIMCYESVARELAQSERLTTRQQRLMGKAVNAAVLEVDTLDDVIDQGSYYLELLPISPDTVGVVTSERLEKALKYLHNSDKVSAVSLQLIFDVVVHHTPELGTAYLELVINQYYKQRVQVNVFQMMRKLIQTHPAVDQARIFSHLTRVARDFGQIPEYMAAENILRNLFQGDEV